MGIKLKPSCIQNNGAKQNSANMKTTASQPYQLVLLKQLKVILRIILRFKKMCFPPSTHVSITNVASMRLSTNLFLPFQPAGLYFLKP